MFKGGLTSQVRRPLHPNLSLAQPQDRYEYGKSRAWSEGSFNVKNMYFSLCKIARVNHRVVEQAPGSGRFSRRPLLGADGFAFNTKRRGGEQWPGRTCRPRLLDGAMDQLHKRGTTD